ncbi:MAG: S8 family serine peptidase [Candidatus Hydrothermae bacterium]|nr:S8 family serine peptidase [Candidatus Hydrothermae bacterium]
MRRTLIGIIIGASVIFGGTLSPELTSRLEKAHNSDIFHVFILPKDQPDYLHLKDMFGRDKKGIADFLRDYASRTQKDILSFLKSRDDVSDVKSFWVANVIEARLPKTVILELSQRDDVGYIEEVPVVKINRAAPDGQSSDPMTPGWNIQQINADDVWAMGHMGDGVIIGQMDTGVDYTHPALSGKWAGYWRDFVNGGSTPYDDNGHGTHTMGTILGGDGPGPDDNDIGVAPHAQFVAVKVFNNQGTGYNIMSGFNWYASIVADSGVPVRVVNNSWGSPSSTSLSFWNAVLTWRSLDIIPVFSIGNEGPNSSTAGTPGNYPTVIGVGATDSGDNIASFSSRGPAPNMTPWNDTTYWSRPDWNLIKPDISAPGVNIRSSVPGGGYQGGYAWSGTSMAAPHITGVIALMLSRNPSLDFDTVYNILLNTAYQPSQGGSYPNNNYGWGRVDALAAVNAVPVLNMPLLVMTGYTIQSGGNDVLDPGETADISVTITNLADSTAENTIGTLTTTCEYITLIDSVADFGNVANGDTVTCAEPFQIQVADDAPLGTTVDFTLNLTCNDGAYSYELHFSSFIGIERSDFLNVNAGNAIFTVTDIGALGYMSSDQAQGSGFIYPKNSVSLLYYGSFAAGNSWNYVVDAWYESGGYDDRDWEPLSNPDGRLYYMPDPPRLASEAVIGAFKDSGHSNPRGLEAHQLAYAYSKPELSDFAIVEYVLKNTGATNINDLYAAYFVDFDISQQYDSNLARIDTTYKTAYMWRSNYAGVVLLNPDEPANLSIIDNSIYVYPSQGMPDSIQIKFMDGTYHFESSQALKDYSIVVSAGPFDLAPGDSQIVAFAVVGGTSDSSYLAHAAMADSVYHDTTLAAVNEMSTPAVRNTNLKLEVNVARDDVPIKFSIPKGEKVQLNIYNASGRLVRRLLNAQLPAGSYSLKWNGMDDAGKPVRSGIYFVNIAAGNHRETARLLLVR